jgi:cell division protein FtsB
MARYPAHRRKPYFGLLVLSVLIVIALWFGRGKHGWLTMIGLQNQERRLHRERLASLARCEILERDIRRLRNDREFLELQARENLGMIRPGETSYRLIPADSLKKKP